jgi:hypothetical protein
MNRPRWISACSSCLTLWSLSSSKDINKPSSYLKENTTRHNCKSRLVDSIQRHNFCSGNHAELVSPWYGPCECWSSQGVGHSCCCMAWHRPWTPKCYTRTAACHSNCAVRVAFCRGHKYDFAVLARLTKSFKRHWSRACEVIFRALSCQVLLTPWSTVPPFMEHEGPEHLTTVSLSRGRPFGPHPHFLNILPHLLRVRDVPGSNPVPETGYPDWGFSCFHSVRLGKFRVVS